MTTNNSVNNNLGVLTTKGDLLSDDGTVNTRQPVGVNGTFLTADSTQTNGLNWVAVSTTPSFSRTFTFMGA
jgi:trimeric autotransporter adhesin